MKVLPILQPKRLLYIYFAVIVVTVVVDYASALQQSELQREPDRPTATEPRKHQQQQPPHAEVNVTANKPLKFGTKIVDYPVVELNSNITTINQQTANTSNNRQEGEKLQTADIQLNNAADIAPSSRVARRYDAPTAPATQLIGENDVPLLKKTQRLSGSTPANASSSVVSIATAPAKSKRRDGNGAHANSRDGKSVAVAASQRSNSFDSQAQSTRQSATQRARNSNATNVASHQTNRGSGKRSRVASQPTSAPAVVGSGQREGSKSRKASRATTISTPVSSSTSTTTTARAPVVSNNLPNNPFSFFSPSLWALSSPPKASSTKKPPKKYTPPPPPVTTTTIAPVKEKKISRQKVKPTTITPLASNQITTTTLPPKKGTTDGPFRIALPTFNFFGTQAQRSNDAVGEKDKRNTPQNLRNLFECPRESEVRFQLFPKICKVDEDCAVWNRDELCCEIFGAKSCVSGIPKPLEETSHTPILGLIPRKCPTRPLAELWWQVQECETDTDCWPRVCCPDGNKRYCRTSQPELETVPVPVKRSFNYLSEYLECTPPPPPIFDLHPKTCASTLDCFPNVCCQEAGLRHCRPPKKSLLTWMANFLNVDFVKRLAQNIVIK
ncbi:mucin-5AC [Zeugodacus cucurbitae]|uniref:mucin-5AC n=1 Tax=Zeugodacus cucurbitae TaxID=28588 RepID=UPI0023D902C7|nr:mucin-5AC [Zeugodacus cucurbitae]